MGKAVSRPGWNTGKAVIDGEVSEACTHRFRRGSDDGMHERGRQGNTGSPVVWPCARPTGAARGAEPGTAGWRMGAYD